MKYSILICAVICLLSCSSKWDSTLLHGNWKTVEWRQLDSGNVLDNTMAFEFDTTGRYTVDYGAELEKGRYWISGDFLHTVEDGKAEKKVRIIKLNTDSLVIEMNRAGYLERLSLAR